MMIVWGQTLYNNLLWEDTKSYLEGQFGSFQALDEKKSCSRVYILEQIFFLHLTSVHSHTQFEMKTDVCEVSA